MIAKIAYFVVLGKPLIFYTGILTLFSFCFTGLVGFLNFRGKRTIPFGWHPKLAVISISLGLIHGLMGLSVYLNI